MLSVPSETSLYNKVSSERALKEPKQLSPRVAEMWEKTQHVCIRLKKAFEVGGRYCFLCLRKTNGRKYFFDYLRWQDFCPLSHSGSQTQIVLRLITNGVVIAADLVYKCLFFRLWGANPAAHTILEAPPHRPYYPRKKVPVNCWTNLAKHLFPSILDWTKTSVRIGASLNLDYKSICSDVANRCRESRRTVSPVLVHRKVQIEFDFDNDSSVSTFQPLCLKDGPQFRIHWGNCKRNFVDLFLCCNIYLQCLLVLRLYCPQY